MHGTHAERGKPVMLLCTGKVNRKVHLIAWPVQDEGRSEGRSVIDRIEGCNITSRESGQTSLWSFSARAFDEPI